MQTETMDGLIARYRAGERVEDLCAETGMVVSTFRREVSHRSYELGLNLKNEHRSNRFRHRPPGGAESYVPLSMEQRRQITQLFLAGDSVSYLGKLFGINHQRVQVCMKQVRAEIGMSTAQMRTTNRTSYQAAPCLDLDRTEQVARRYVSGQSLIEIGCDLRLSHQTMTEGLNEHFPGLLDTPRD